MLNKKKIFIILGVLVLAVFVYVVTPKVDSYFMWKRAVKAAGGFPTQLGLTNVLITACTLNPSGTCVGAGAPPDPTATPFCNMVPGVCNAYAYVSGTPAGGTGTGALFSIAMISEAGLTPGGQLIAGGMSPTLMDSGVLASAGGCAGCIGLTNRIKDWFNFSIAGKRDN